MGVLHVVRQAVAKNGGYNCGCQAMSAPQQHTCNTEDIEEQKPEQSGREEHTMPHLRPDTHKEGRIGSCWVTSILVR